MSCRADLHIPVVFILSPQFDELQATLVEIQQKREEYLVLEAKLIEERRIQQELLEQQQQQTLREEL